MTQPGAGHIDAVTTLRRDIGYIIGLLNLAHEAVICIDEKSSIVVFNQGAENIFGYTAEEILGRSLDVLVPEAYREKHREHVLEFHASQETCRVMSERSQVNGVRSNGQSFPAEASISKFSYGGQITMTVILRDISERAAEQMDAFHKIDHDPQTSLPNRVLFQDRFDMAIARSKRKDSGFGLMVFDFGDLEQDTVDVSPIINAVAHRISGVIRNSDTLARTGGYQLSVLTEDMSSGDSMNQIVRRIRAKIDSPIPVLGRDHSVSPGFGTALYPEQGQALDQLFGIACAQAVNTDTTRADTKEETV